MNGFDLDQLRTLVAAVDAGSLTAAAPRRHRSQSAVSEQLRKLEEQAGSSLLVRGKAGVVPTEAGARLVEHARHILALSETAWRDLRGLQLQGDVRLAITDYFRPVHIAGMLAQFAARHPGIRFHVHIDRSDAIEEGYARGLFDVAIVMRVAGAQRAPGATALGSEALAWTGTAQTRLDKGAPLPLVALPQSCALRRLAESALERRRQPYYIAHVASGIAGVRFAVAAGLGIACLNLSALDGPLLALAPGRRLPALPQVRFQVLAARQGEAAIAASVRALTVETFSRLRHG
ncbi:LysR family transcriptional regulator [Paracidovorax anthurii]|uniref:DNA-binding transcriptional LysR family regulator n=1 Tax=Paracidovorax anthurii TaxID=78229 RepID=A0A328ZJY6_9BURK|nr:LysR substrate-binding domain-containing protein [Paracidovorax anthurii]RAR84952.1 DNA-binding transcriptional LysR family regulator [Paracidovorax anthurii]